jgi:hypothetical protein
LERLLAFLLFAEDVEQLGDAGCFGRRYECALAIPQFFQDLAYVLHLYATVLWIAPVL